MENRKNPKLKVIITSIIFIIIVITLAAYTTNSSFRNYIDTKLLNKHVSKNNLATIEINSDDNPTPFAYDDYIGVLRKNRLLIYNNKSNLLNELTINITTPFIYSNGKYVTISEKDGNKFYVINNTNLLWQGKIDGKIEKININQNGYVSIIASNSTYKSIVIVFDNNGNELFKTFLPSTYAMCSAISTNNSFLAIGEVNYSGTVIKSNIRIMSIDSAKIIYNYSAPNNDVITNIKYADKEKAICMFTNSIVSVTSNGNNVLYNMNNNIAFSTINISNHFAVVEGESSGLFSHKYQLKIYPINSNNENLYFLDNKLPKQMLANGKIIALNYGSEVDIITQNGTLKKNYISSKQIKDLIVGESIVGIIYKDKIEIIDV